MSAFAPKAAPEPAGTPDRDPPRRANQPGSGSGRLTRRVAASSVLVSIAIAGCGSSGASTTVARVNELPQTPPAAVQVSAPADGSTIAGGHVTVRGTVTPTTASVQVLGLRAAVSNGVFSRAVPMKTGANKIDVVASGPGIAPATSTITVTRAAAQVTPPHAAAAPTTTSQPAAAPTTVRIPSVAGERLDVAEMDLTNAGLTFTEVGGGAFGIVVKSNWKVCQSRPAPGSRAPNGSSVALIVDRPANC